MIVSVADLALTGVNLRIFKLLRLFRVLRPLRVISRNDGLKISIQCLIQSGPAVLNLTFISILFFLIFGIMGVNYFKGLYYYCDNETISADLIESLVHKWDCLNAGGDWLNYSSNFDSILNAMVTLFHMSSTVGWAAIMYRAVKSTDIDYMPKSNQAPYIGFFFVVFIIVGSFFILNLFVGVVISTYNRERERLGRNFLLTENQRSWV